METITLVITLIIGNFGDMKKVNLISGDKYGMLEVVMPIESHRQPNGQTKSMYQCKCECGNIVNVQMYHLKSGHSKSCGCTKKEVSRLAGQKHFTHGHWKGNKSTPEYNTWCAMRNRCYNKNHKDYKYWGAKGVIVCDRWVDSFSNFIEDMGLKPTAKHSLDRINPFGNYELSNCRWATSSEQANNKRIHYANI